MGGPQHDCSVSAGPLGLIESLNLLGIDGPRGFLESGFGPGLALSTITRTEKSVARVGLLDYCNSSTIHHNLFEIHYKI